MAIKRNDLNGELLCPLAVEWRATAQKRIELTDKVEEMHMSFSQIKQDTQYLTILPHMLKSLDEMKKNLIAPATGRKQVPLISHLLMMAVFGIIIAVLLLKDGNKELHIDAKGIHLQEKKTAP